MGSENQGAADSRVVPLRSFWIALVLLLIPSLFFVTNQSLWVDEANSAWFADHARGLNPDQFHGLAAVPEMPAFHLLLMGWVHLFGDSERALRAINVPFAALFLGSILMLCRVGRGRAWWVPAAPFAFFPLLTYYVNECRAYTALLGLSTAAICALLVYAKAGGRRAAWVCCICGLTAFSMHLFGAFFILATILFVLIDSDIRQRLQQDWKSWIAPVLVSLPGYLALALYYVKAGRENIAVNQIGLNPDTPGNMASSWKNVVFFFYESFGFSGLGPPRNALRVHPSVHSFDGYFVLMLLGAIAVVALCLCAIKTGKKTSAAGLFFCASVGVAVLFAFARAFHFGFFGRHGMGLVALLCCSFVLVLSSRDISNALRYATVGVLMLAWGVSSARLLFMYPYAKDDVRSALQVASTSGLPTLWNAGDSDAAYYGGFNDDGWGQKMPAGTASTAASHWHKLSTFYLLPNVKQEQIDSFTSRLDAGKYIMVKGKADVFDADGSWSDAMSAWQPRLLNRLNGFDVWQVTLPRYASQQTQ